MTEKEKKKKRKIKYVSRKTPGGTYKRILFDDKVIVGLNSHTFRGEQTKHIHIGDKKFKIILKPKKLRGIWVYDRERKRYVKLRRKKKKDDKNKGNRSGNKRTRE